MNLPLRVLIVEDESDDAELVVIELESGGYDPKYKRVDTPAAMNAALDEEPWDIIICDHSMPHFSAPAALTLLKEKGLDLPFIIVSGSIGEEIAVAAMKAGACDYVLKNNLARLVPAVERELREAWVRIERRRAEETLHYLAFYDVLTGLPNQALFLDHLRQSIEQAQNHPDYLFAVLYLDLDRFQMVKYSLGHGKSDELLVAAAGRLKTCLRPTDILARLGGDEFAILLAGIQDPQDADTAAKCIHQAMKSPFNLKGSVVFSDVSIGMVVSTIGYDQPEDFLRAADTAMHHVKVQGTGYSALFDIDMHSRAVSRLHMETDLRQAIKLQQFHLNYQPIVSLATGRLAGFEALVRWQHPERGLISPDEFISVAEETGLIIPLGEWVLQEACRQLKAWHQQFPHHLPLSVSVNLSGIQLQTPDLIAQIDQLLQTVELPGHCLKLEITESMLLENAAAAAAVLEQLQARQIQVSIDDFGTGYSSLSYLHCLPINTLKIDRSFVNRMSADRKNLNIVKAILNLARSLELDVVAEGVETQQQWQHLQALGCEYGQGYFISRPLEEKAVVAWVKHWSDKLSLMPKV